MKVCILGSGLTALSLAKALVNQKIYVDIVALHKKPNIEKSRTIGISKSNYEFFDKNIIKIQKINWKLKKIEIYTENLKNEKILNFENNKNQLFSIIKNHQIYEALNKSLSKNKYCKKTKYKKTIFKLDKYNLIVNTDYNSILTKKYFNKKIEKAYNSFAFTTVINHDKISNDTAIQIFTKIGPLAFLPYQKIKLQLCIQYIIQSMSIGKK